MTARPPAVAGAFYPADAGRLRNVLRQCFAAAIRDDDAAPAPGAFPKAIIAPHAGYIYSGAVAAAAYARLRPARGVIQRVVLLGPAHRVAVRGLATVTVDTFTTPLGDVAIDHDAIQQIARLRQATVSDRAHEQEHSLETQLPFLQAVLGDGFKLVPFAVGDATAEEVAQVLAILWGGEETLVVISSDLSHFHDYETARRMDRQTSDNIVNLRYERLGYEDACGRAPVSGLLYLAAQRNYCLEMLDLRNSADTAGDKSSVVGYGAYALTTTKQAA